jgi:hypothetical protein
MIDKANGKYERYPKDKPLSRGQLRDDKKRGRLE